MDNILASRYLYPNIELVRIVYDGFPNQFLGVVTDDFVFHIEREDVAKYIFQNSPPIQGE